MATPGRHRLASAGKREKGRLEARGRPSCLVYDSHAGGSHAVKQTARWSGDQTVKQSDGPKDARQRDTEDGVINDGSHRPAPCNPLPAPADAVPKAQRGRHGSTAGASREGHKEELPDRQTTDRRHASREPRLPSGPPRRSFPLPRDTPGWRCRAECHRQGESLAATPSRRDWPG